MMMNLNKALDLISVLTGFLGALLNALLFWVIGHNTTIDRKCALIYQNLAAVDIFNCFVIPMCYLSVRGHGYDIDLHNTSDSILYLLFGGTIEVPYMLLILLSVARVMIFKNPTLYANKLSVLSFKVIMLACWILAIGSGVGIWLCFLLSGTAKKNHLVNLMKVQGATTIVLIIVTVALITTSLVLLGALTSNITFSRNTAVNTADKKNSETHITTQVGTMEETSDHQRIVQKSSHRPSASPSSTSTSTSPTVTTNILSEISSARRTLSYFFVSVSIWSSFPFVFAVSFTACGPNYNSTHPACELLQNPVLSDPKLSYAITLLFLCGLSIANAVILLRQRSFKNVISSLRIFKPKCTGAESEQVQVIQVGVRSGEVIRSNRDGTPMSFYRSPGETMKTPRSDENSESS